MCNQIASLQLEIQNDRDELRSLKADARSKDETIKTLEQKVLLLEQELLHQEYAAQIGKKVRMRFLEGHRRRMGLRGTATGHIPTGNRAAHRGRPLVDALLYRTGERDDVEVYIDLYGVDPLLLLQFEDIGEIIEVCGFYGTLKSNG